MLGLSWATGSRVALDCRRDFLEAPELRRRYSRVQCARSIGPGALPSVGKDGMDLLRYRMSGILRLSGQQLLEPLPEIAKIARVEVDKANPSSSTVLGSTSNQTQCSLNCTSQQLLCQQRQP